jgi:NAD(P)-dependent dehydrogenase (short-subunit alcohol dehydrogenase family)
VFSRDCEGRRVLGLENKVAVITGGNSAIGFATAREFAANGAKVVIFGRDRRTLDRAAGTLGGNAPAFQGDVRKLADLDRLFAGTNARFGKIDILVANAGIANFAPVDSLSETLFDGSHSTRQSGLGRSMHG